MAENLVTNFFWDKDARKRPISFRDLLKRAAADDQPTTEPIRFLGCELPWEFHMPTVVTGLPRGFELYELTLREDGSGVDPAATGPDPAAADAWRDARISRSWQDNLRELVASPASVPPDVPFMEPVPFWRDQRAGAPGLFTALERELLTHWSSSSASAGGTFGLITGV